jgi:peroxiredoxin
MKKAILLLTIVATLFACNQKGNENAGFSIDGTIAGFDSSYVLLKKAVEGELVTIDSFLVSQGKFSFKDTVKMPEMYYLIFGDNMHRTELFVENSPITFSANYDSLDVAIVKGSKVHDEFKAYKDETLPFENKMSDLYQQYKAASDQKNEVLMKQIDSTYEALDKDMNAFIKNYIVTHKSSPVAPYILTRISYNLELKELDSIVSQFDKSLDSSVYAINMKQRVEILKNVEVGKVAPDFTLNDTTGNPVALSSFKGKYLLIDFWAAWCGPCRRENPNNVKLYKEFNKKGFEILGVSFDNDREKWIGAIKSDKLEWTQVSDLKGWKSAAGKLYGVNSIPHTVLLDKEGVIIAKNLVGDELKAKVKELLK